MTFYLDASVIVSALVRQARSDSVDRFLSSCSKPFAISSFAAGEAVSALSRLHRTGELDEAAAREALSDLDTWIAARGEADTEAADIRLAQTLVRNFEIGLRMPDSIHVATCLRMGLILVTLDGRLANAAEALNVRYEVPA